MGDQELEIEEYVDGRMPESRRREFEARLRQDQALRRQVESVTRSVEFLEQALPILEPSEDFEKKVSSQIVVITQSNPNLRPAARRKTGGDLEAELQSDPRRRVERRRLLWLALIAGALFLAAAAVMARVWFPPAPARPPLPAPGAR
jgi:anti-sigma factor RsiW